MGGPDVSSDTGSLVTGPLVVRESTIGGIGRHKKWHKISEHGLPPDDGGCAENSFGLIDGVKRSTHHQSDHQGPA